MNVRFVAIWAGLLFTLPICRSQAATPPEPLPVRTNAEQLRQLTPDEAQRGYPVRIEGVVTYYDPDWSILFVQDSTGGTFVSTEGKAFPVHSGERVEVEGFSNSSDVLPVIIRPEIRLIGPGTFPPAKKPSLLSLQTGAIDCDWVQIVGVVRKASVEKGHLKLEINDSQRRWNVFVIGIQVGELPVEELADRTIQFQGVAAVTVDETRRIREYKMFVPDTEHCVLQKSPVEISFDTPVTPILSLKELDVTKAPFHRFHIQGVVTFSDTGPYFVMQDSTAGLRVQRPERTEVTAGDFVDVLGYYSPGLFSPVLEDVTLRRQGAAPLPKALVIQADKVVWNDADSKLVRLDGSLLDQSVDAKGPVLILQAGGVTFSATLARANTNTPFSFPPNGSRVRVTGVCWKQVDQPGKFQTFQILMSDPKQVETLDYLQSISRKRVLQALALGVLGMGAALVWVVLLRQRVRQQTELIRERLERETALEKRCHELIQNAREVIFTLDLDHRITSINLAGEKVLGYSTQELIGKNIQQLVAPDQQAATREWMAGLSAEAAPPNREMTLVSRAGKQVVFDVSLRQTRPVNPLAPLQGIARDITDRKRLETERERLIRDLQNALDNVKTLSGLLPICAHCKKIRDDKGYWNRIESYITDHSGAQFTHGMCPECTKMYFPDL